MSTLNGLPAHVLLVHVIVVLLPLAALLLAVTAWWPVARRRLAGPNALLALAVLGLVPVTTDAGEWLEHRVGPSELVRAHAELGDTAIWAAVPVAVLALIVWWRQREAAFSMVPPGPAEAQDGTVRPRRTVLAPGSAAVGVVIAVLSVMAAAGAVYDVYRIGDSGAQASWQGNFSQTSDRGGDR
ncbi:DUF2231 domain-containing protein [Longispora sp. K20-0274]|uniref:hypothetical protein n=1 Tax=Longispora sp. K20-0274 TaxID=3088255 RepID=UPI00399C378B